MMRTAHYFSRDELAVRWNRGVRSVDLWLRRPDVEIRSVVHPMDRRKVLYLKTDVRRVERAFGITVSDEAGR